MQFKIGSRRYALRLMEGSITSEGQPCLGACLQSSREILISAECEPRDRMRVLLRELSRAWTFETGKPRDDEGWHSHTASVSMASAIDLNAQGGEFALISLRPGESPQPGAARMGMCGNRYCQKCNTSVASGSVAWRPGDLPGTVEMRMFCDFCARTQIWPEFTDARGLPSNRAAADARYEPGDTTGLGLSLNRA